MTDKAISPLLRRLIEDMTIRRLSSNTDYRRDHRTRACMRTRTREN